jgi:WD40 repeat protein
MNGMETIHQSSINCEVFFLKPKFVILSYDRFLLVKKLVYIYFQWDIRSGETVQEYDRHLGAVNSITFVDQNRRFVSTSDDKSLRVWEWYTLNLVKSVKFKLTLFILYISEHLLPLLSTTVLPLLSTTAIMSSLCQPV